MKKKIIAIIMMICMLSGVLTGCGNNSEASAIDQTAASDTISDSASGITFVPGTYEGTGSGFNGEITVEVTVTEDAITSVAVKSHNETAGLADPALEQIPNAIIQYQSLGVDTVSGATMTSSGLLDAISNALEQAGADISLLRALPINRQTASAEDMYTQVVVAGSGMGGMSTAATAANEGAEVILVEKLGALGGSAGTAAGGLVVVDSNLIPSEMDGSLERTMAYVRLMNETSIRQPNYEFLAEIVAQTGETVDYYAEEFGIEPEFTDRGDFIRGIYPGGGRALIDGLADTFESNGGKILLNTRAEEIVMDGDQAVGLRVVGEDGPFTIYADKIIIATGGANWDTERMLAENPELNTVAMRIISSVGNTGDGFRMLEEIGAKMGDGPRIKDAMVGFSSLPTFASLSDLMVFDAEGIRFSNEAPVFATMNVTFLQRRASPAYYALFSADQVDEDLLAALQEDSIGDDPNKTVYGETIEELAEKLQIPAEQLRATFDRYQELCANGVDLDFGKDAANLVAYSENGGYYAASLQASTWGTYGGAITDGEFRVLREDGSIVLNVFAVGECANSEFYGDYYYGAFSLGLYSTAGKLAGQAAAREINSTR